MCGLYSFRKSAEETRSLLQYLEELEFPPRIYVAPQSPIAIVRLENNERRRSFSRKILRNGLMSGMLTPGRRCNS